VLANPIAVTDRLSQATLRQRNTYFSSSDAAFPDRYAASALWAQVKDGTMRVDGGWRIYSSGPGIYAALLIRHVLGYQRQWGKRFMQSLRPKALQDVTAGWDGA
jgi:1,2-beta-oligoglucan phosphorylase